MPTNLPNRAQITYTSGTSQNTAISNQTNTTLVDQYTMLLTKDVLDNVVRLGDTATYVLRLTNTGAGALYNPTITDNLGSVLGADTPLSYVADSAVFYLNGTPVGGTAQITTAGVTFTAAAVLQPGDNLIIVYSAQTVAESAGQITNTAGAQANSGTPEGAVITAAATQTITTESVEAPQLSIFKSADKDSVVSGDTLTYTFTILNTGSLPAESVNFTDVLPPEFTVTSVTLTQNGTTTTLLPTDYAIEPQNTLVIPAAGSLVVINVPAATAEGPGVSVITVTGTIA